MIDYKEFGLGPLHYYCEVEQDFKIEEFRAVKDFEGLYEVSDLGRVKSLERITPRPIQGDMYHKAKILKAKPNKSNYLALSLYIKANSKKRKIHQLVNHKDFNTYNNILSNLEIVAQRVNGNQKHIASTSTHTGVYWHTRDKRWLAGIRVGEERIHLGSFTDEAQAGRAYELALKEINLL